MLRSSWEGFIPDLERYVISASKVVVTFWNSICFGALPIVIDLLHLPIHLQISSAMNSSILSGHSRESPSYCLWWSELFCAFGTSNFVFVGFKSRILESSRRIRLLVEDAAIRNKVKVLRCDNGGEYDSKD